MRFALRTGKPDGPFERSLKKLKKYRRAREDIDAALAAMIGTEVPNPPNVSLIPGVGRTVLKVRVASSDMKSGKSGGFRVLLDQRREVWVPILVYAKPDRADASRAEILAAALDENI